MTTQTLNPTGSSGAGVSLTGGATAHAVLSDASDASYVSFASIYGSVACDLTDHTMTAGAVSRHVVPRLRLSASTSVTGVTVEVRTTRNGASVLLGSQQIQLIGVGGGGAANYLGAPVPVKELTAAEVNALVVNVIAPGAAITPPLFYKLSADLVYALKPTTAIVTAPSTSQSQPTVAFSHTPGTDGAAQSAYQVVVATAAQYGAGGFDPATSAVSQRTGTVLSAETSLKLATVTNGTTYRVYVRTAQLINNELHWADWVNSQWTASFTVATVTAVAVTVHNTDGYNEIDVTRSGGTAWQSLEVQRTDDVGVTWVNVRGGVDVAAVDSKFCMAWTSSAVELRDYEAPNGVASAQYRARGMTAASGVDVRGPWVYSTPAAGWVSNDIWLKSVYDPALNVKVDLSGSEPSPVFGIDQAVLHPPQRAAAIVVSSVRQEAEATLGVETLTAAEANALKAVVAATSLLLQFPDAAPFLFGSEYIAAGALSADATADAVGRARYWSLPFWVSERPEDI